LVLWLFSSDSAIFCDQEISQQFTARAGAFSEIALLNSVVSPHETGGRMLWAFPFSDLMIHIN
jgi:hypothetical protein